jgi:ABC-type glycerol-3-phosphate transport system substrate-binding protein
LSRFRIGVAAVALASACALAATAFAGTQGSKVTTLTLWQNYGQSSKATATTDLVAAFEKLHPDIKINVVAQPGSNWFALLKAASISKSGPDLAVLWTGVFVTQYQNLYTNLTPSLTSAEMATIRGKQYLAPNENLSKGIYVVPYDYDAYIGFYNKALFKKAGIASFPKNWTELQSACTKLNSIGVTPMIYGLTGGLTLGAEFYPWFDFAYVLIGAGYSPAQWRGLYTGQIPWTSPKIVTQLTKWASLRTSGCTNKDVLTASNTIPKFTSGKAAMIVDGTFDTGVFQKGLGKNLGVFVPPYADKAINGVEHYPGDGIGVTSWSTHKTEAEEFTAFLTTAQAGGILAKDGVSPNRAGYAAHNAVWTAINNFETKQKMAVYPYIDNVIQVPVWNLGSKQLVAAFAGNIKPLAALQSLKQALDGLPASQKK